MNPPAPVPPEDAKPPAIYFHWPAFWRMVKNLCWTGALTLALNYQDTMDALHDMGPGGFLALVLVLALGSALCVLLSYWLLRARVWYCENAGSGDPRKAGGPLAEPQRATARWCYRGGKRLGQLFRIK